MDVYILILRGTNHIEAVFASETDARSFLRRIYSPSDAAMFDVGVFPVLDGNCQRAEAPHD